MEKPKLPARGKRNHNQVAFIKHIPKGHRLECKDDLEEKAYVIWASASKSGVYRVLKTSLSPALCIQELEG